MDAPSKLRLPESTAATARSPRRSPRRSVRATAPNCRCRSCSHSRRGEAELVELDLQPGGGIIVADHLTARREARLDPGPLTLRPRSLAFFATSPAASITLGFECCAAGDRGDHDVAVAELVIGAGDLGPARLVDPGEPRQLGIERCRHLPSATRSCGRAARRATARPSPNQARRVGEDRVGVLASPPYPCALA